MANRLLITLTIPVLLGSFLAFSPASSYLQEELTSQFALDLDFGTRDCSKIPVSEFRGVVFIDHILSGKESGVSFVPSSNYVSDSMRQIRLHDMNFVRVPMNWESYANNSAVFLAEVELVARAAADNDLCVIFDNHHWYTSSYWGIQVIGDAEGRGFPSYVVKDFPLMVADDEYVATAAPFWSAFLKNEIIVDGRPVWDVQLDYLEEVIQRVDRFDNVVGYEIMNEPHLFNASQYEDLGRYHTYMAKEIRQVTDKRIFFDRETAWGFQRNPSLEYQILPQNVSGVVYTPHLYSVPYDGSQAEGQIKKFKSWSEEWGMEVLVGEWSARSQLDTDVFLSSFKENEFGWTYYSWRPTESRGRGVSLYDANWIPATEGLQQLTAAMEKLYGADEPDGLGTSSRIPR